MTEILYTTNAYVQTFAAVVTAVTDDNGVTLDKTAFYPGGGGQPNDEGTLTAGDQTWTVTKVKKVGGDVVPFVEGVLPGVGTAVTGQLDWDRRYKLIRTHTAMHILCGVVWRDYGASVTGGNMDPLQGRMDFEFETMRQELVAEIETAVNARRGELLDGLARLLRPSGLLVLGVGEVTGWSHPQLTRTGGRQTLAFLRNP